MSVQFKSGLTSQVIRSIQVRLSQIGQVSSVQVRSGSGQVRLLQVRLIWSVHVGQLSCQFGHVRSGQGKSDLVR